MTPSLLVMRSRTPAGKARLDALVAHWRTRLDRVPCPGNVAVLVSPTASLRVLAPDIILVGSLFGGCPRIDRGEASAMLSQITRSSWGSYLAIATAVDGTYAMVDPSGAGRAHLAYDSDLTLVSDRLTPALMRQAGFAVTVDMTALAGCLMDPGTIPCAPLISGVVPMVAGAAYDLAAPQAAQTIWAPKQIPTSDGDGTSLRVAVDKSVAGMLQERTPLIELSGGLDSSIVAATMTHLGLDPRAVTVELPGGDVDEVGYARATAERCGIDLQVSRVTDYPDLDRVMAVEQTAHPYLYGIDGAFSAAIGSALTKDSGTVVTGQGGDAVFYQPSTVYTTIDRCRSLGLRSGWAALLDDARRSRTSIWPLLHAVLADRVHGSALPPDDLGAMLLTREAKAERRRSPHPWVEAARDEPPGRQLQLLMIANSQMFHSARALDPERSLLHPLLAQPVLEAALALPTWRLACGPLDRGLARRVFADRLAPVVAARRSKGAAAAFYSRTALSNLANLRERLLDGALVKAGIIDAAAMDRTLTAEALFYSLDYPALILHASCEAWLGAWTS